MSGAKKTLAEAPSKYPNKYKVNKDQWKKWGPWGQATFNWLMDLGMKNSQLFMHPDTQARMAPSAKHPLGEKFRGYATEWKTVVWNFSWLAAGQARDAYKMGLKEGFRDGIDVAVVAMAALQKAQRARKRK